MIRWILLITVCANALVYYNFARMADEQLGVAGGRDLRVGGGRDQIILLSELKEKLPKRHQLAISSVDRLDPDPRGEAEERYEVAAGSEDLTAGDVQNVAASDPDEERSAVVEDEPLGDGAAGLEEVGLGLFAEQSVLLSPTPRACVRIGRFDKERDANKLAGKILVAASVVARVRATVEGLERYWVYLPPFASREEAWHKKAELKKKDIDSSLIYTGNLRNALSLGYFGSKENAVRQKKKGERAGYSVTLATVSVELTRYWLELDEAAIRRLSELFWEDVARLYPGVVRESVLCRDVAGSDSGL